MNLTECIEKIENVINRTATYNSGNVAFDFNGGAITFDFGPHSEAVKAVKEAREALSYMRMVDRGETNI